MKLLSISGSLRGASTNTALLTTLSQGAPPQVDICHYPALAQLPIFNPDDEGPPAPEPVRQLVEAVIGARGIIISSPEYAHGVPGGLKNALDWLVSHPQLPHKPVMLLSATHRGAHAQAALREILTTMSLTLVDDAAYSLSLIGKTPEQCRAILKQSDVQADLQSALVRFCDFIAKKSEHH